MSPRLPQVWNVLEEMLILFYSRHSLGSCSVPLIIHLPRIHDLTEHCFDRLRLVPRPSVYQRFGQLECYLHRIPSFLLCHEEAEHQPDSSAMDRSLPAICCLDWACFFHRTPADWRLHYLYPWTVSYASKCMFARSSNADNNRWSTETFVSSYINIPIFIVLYFGYKLVRKTKIVHLEDVPILKYLEIAENNPEPPAAPIVEWRRFNILWS